MVAAWAMTLLRFPLLFAGLTALTWADGDQLACFAILALMLADILDGELLRVSSSASRRHRMARHVFDALSDRLVIQCTFAVALWAGSCSLFVYSLMLAREAALVLTVSIPFIQNRVVLDADGISKLATAFLGALLINSICPLLPELLLLIPFVGLSAWGTRRYVRQYETALHSRSGFRWLVRRQQARVS